MAMRSLRGGTPFPFFSPIATNDFYGILLAMATTLDVAPNFLV
jgi:hypothetical protein